MDFHGLDLPSEGHPIIEEATEGVFSNGPDVFGLDVEELPEGRSADAFFLIVRTLDEDGDVNISYRWSADIQTWEVVGLLRIATLAMEEDHKAQQAAAVWEADEEEED